MKYVIYSDYKPIHREKIMERAPLFMKDREDNPRAEERDNLLYVT